jgi:hypothetical protein
MGIGGLHAHIAITPLGGVSSLDFGLSSPPSWGLFFCWQRGTGEVGADRVSTSYNIIPVENTCEPEAVHTWSIRYDKCSLHKWE